MRKTAGVTFNIPAAPDYHLKNIMNFAGLNLSNNTFHADYRTAKDVKNLYVNDENILTTRPRLDAVYHTNKVSAGSITDSTNVRRIYLDEKHYLDIARNEQYIRLAEKDFTHDITYVYFIDATGISDFDTTFDMDNCSAFKYDDKIYILDGDRYYVAKDKNEILGYKLYNVYNDSDTYIPTTRVTVDGVTWSDLEDYNLLTDKYKEAYIGAFTEVSIEDDLDYSAMFSDITEYTPPTN